MDWFWIIFIKGWVTQSPLLIFYLWFFDIHFQTFGLFVIWSLGISMIFFSGHHLFNHEKNL